MRGLAPPFLLLLAAASARAAAEDRGPLVPVSGRSPFHGCVLDQPRRQPGRFVADSEVEPRLAVDPGDPLHLVGVFQQDRWSNGGARGLVAGVSFDGGSTWREVVIPGLTACSGGRFLRSSDPWVAIAVNGDVYQAGLGLDEVRQRLSPFTGVLGSAVQVSKSTDGGLTWSVPLSLADDGDGALHDKESVTTDPMDAALAYVIWDRVEQEGDHFTQPTLFSRTTDGGRTWEQARIIHDPGLDNQTIGHQILVLPDGSLRDAFTESVVFRAPDGRLRYASYFSLLRSPDKGRTWAAAAPLPNGRPWIEAVEVRGTFDPDTGRDDVRTGSYLVDAAVDPASGNLYSVWQDSRFRGYQYDGIAFVMSTDGGIAWSAPIPIQQTPTNVPAWYQQAFTPSVRVAADGTVGVTYYDFRNNTPSRFHGDGSHTGPLTDYWLVRCNPRRSDCTEPESWRDEVRLTDVPFDLEKAPFARGFFVGDYQGLGSNGDFLALFSQPEGSDPASVFFRRVRP